MCMSPTLLVRCLTSHLSVGHSYRQRVHDPIFHLQRSLKYSNPIELYLKAELSLFSVC